MHRIFPAFLTLLLLLVLLQAGCSSSGSDNDPLDDTNDTQDDILDDTQDDTQTDGNIPPSPTDAVVLIDDHLAGLPPVQRYAALNNLMATLYKGVEVAEFFNLAAGLSTPVARSDAPSLATIATRLDTPLTNFSDIIAFLTNKYFFDERRLRNTRALAMALLWELPLSREYFHRWIAYRLANTILFSPGQELDSVSHVDVQEIFNRLSHRLDQGASIREIVEEHLHTEANWRRFRSPEDNTREMMELFLDRFIDSEVPLASIACQNWFLTDESDGYQLLKSQDTNSDPLDFLETTGIVSCDDFYREVAMHPALIPTVVARVVAEFFPTASGAEHEDFVNEIVISRPETFQEIYRALLFSRKYLLESSRTWQFEEAYFPVADRIAWVAHRNFFHNLNDRSPGDNPPDLSEMRQETMTFKIGRSPFDQYHRYHGKLTKPVPHSL